MKYIENYQENKRIYEGALKRIKEEVEKATTEEELDDRYNYLLTCIEDNCNRMAKCGFCKEECNEMQNELTLRLQGLIQYQADTMATKERNEFVFEF